MFIIIIVTIKLGQENQKAEITRRIDIPINLRKRAYDSCILPVASYGLESMTITKHSANRLRTTQKAMERAMLGTSLKDRVRNDEIRRRTRVSDIIKRTAELKWRWVGHVARQDREKWTLRVIQWRPRETKRSTGRPQRRWIDDIKDQVGGQWLRIAQDRHEWKRHGEDYDQKWTEEG
ncbi:hypothetical protein HHI36_022128 [Cryptolaemus montrouzieri]|uniref:Endonuclease-reverse transcriptase n=1 Tax=Cryptolaemus montrouzieri TaxID=559131 RepID=A0ABD2N073_9CUCU